MFRNFRIRRALEEYEISREFYREWRDRYIGDTVKTKAKKRRGMYDESVRMNNSVNKLLRLGVPFNKYYTLNNGVSFIIYSDSKCSAERRIWIKN